MFIVLGVLLPIGLFVATLPLKVLVSLIQKVIKKEEKLAKSGNKGGIISSNTDPLAERLGKKDKGKTSLSKLKVLRLKALRYSISLIKNLIRLLRSVSKIFIFFTTSACILVLTIFISLAVILSSITVLLVDDATFTSTVGSKTNIVSTNKKTEGNATLLASLETMGKWYISDVKVYNQSGHKHCDLINGEVREDCTGFSYAVLVYSGYVTGNPSSAPASSSYLKNGAMYNKLTKVGFTYHDVGNDFVFQAGDLLAYNGHVEFIVSTDEDTCKTFGWGSVKTEYPSTTSSASSLCSKYSCCYRLGGS